MKTIKTKNGKSYTKKQIYEAIEYWKKQLKRLNEAYDENKINNAILYAAKKNHWNDATDFANHIAQVFNSDKYLHELDKKRRIEELIKYFGNDKKCSYNTIMNIVRQTFDNNAEEFIDNQLNSISTYINAVQSFVNLYCNYTGQYLDDILMKKLKDANAEIKYLYNKLYDGFYYEISLDNILKLCYELEYELDQPYLMYDVDDLVNDESKNKQISSWYKKSLKAYADLCDKVPDIKEFID